MTNDRRPTCLNSDHNHGSPDEGDACRKQADVDFRDQVASVIGNLKWMQDVMLYDKPSPEQLAEFADIADRAVVAIRLLIKVGLAPAGLWGVESDALWIRPASEWPHD